LTCLFSPAPRTKLRDAEWAIEMRNCKLLITNKSVRQSCREADRRTAGREIPQLGSSSPSSQERDAGCSCAPAQCCCKFALPLMSSSQYAFTAIFCPLHCLLLFDTVLWVFLLYSPRKSTDITSYMVRSGGGGGRGPFFNTLSKMLKQNVEALQLTHV
jgi:hypothetical protein